MTNSKFINWLQSIIDPKVREQRRLDELKARQHEILQRHQRLESQVSVQLQLQVLFAGPKSSVETPPSPPETVPVIPDPAAVIPDSAQAPVVTLTVATAPVPIAAPEVASTKCEPKQAPKQEIKVHVLSFGERTTRDESQIFLGMSLEEVVDQCLQYNDLQAFRARLISALKTIHKTDCSGIESCESNESYGYHACFDIGIGYHDDDDEYHEWLFDYVVRPLSL